jgi:dCMP deaminase
MQRLSHDEYYLKILVEVCRRSTCTRRKVGAIITDKQHRILGVGYNGVPRGFVHCNEHSCLGAHDKPGDSDRCMAVHAEVNAVIQCDRLEDAHRIYVSCDPCFTCAKMIANTSIKFVITSGNYADERGSMILKNAGITLRRY